MPRAKHSYLRTHQLAGKIIGFNVLEEDTKLRERAASAKSGRAAKTLVKEGRLRVTLVALRSGTALGVHTVKGEVTLQTVRGTIDLGFEGRSVRAPKGRVIALRAGVPHDARAIRDAALLITSSMH